MQVPEQQGGKYFWSMTLTVACETGLESGPADCTQRWRKGGQESKLNERRRQRVAAGRNRGRSEARKGGRDGGRASSGRQNPVIIGLRRLTHLNLFYSLQLESSHTS